MIHWLEVLRAADAAPKSNPNGRKRKAGPTDQPTLPPPNERQKDGPRQLESQTAPVPTRTPILAGCGNNSFVTEYWSKLKGKPSREEEPADSSEYDDVEEGAMSSRSRDLQDLGHDGSDGGQDDEAEGTHRSERPPTDVTVANRLIITGITQSAQLHKV